MTGLATSEVNSGIPVASIRIEDNAALATGSSTPVADASI